MSTSSGSLPVHGGRRGALNAYACWGSTQVRARGGKARVRGEQGAGADADGDSADGASGGAGATDATGATGAAGAAGAGRCWQVLAELGVSWA